MDDEKLKKMINLTFICLDCQSNIAMCFKCKKKGSYFPELNNSKSKSKVKAEEKEEEFQTDPPSATDKEKNGSEIADTDTAKMELESDTNASTILTNGKDGK